LPLKIRFIVLVFLLWLSSLRDDLLLLWRGLRTVKHDKIEILEFHFAKGVSDILLDIGRIIDFVGDKKLLSLKGHFELVRDLFSILVLHLTLSIKYISKCRTDSLLIIGDIEVGIPGVRCLHDKIIQVEGFVIGLEIEHTQAD
jgi:type III secretory pathway component EscU